MKINKKLLITMAIFGLVSTSTLLIYLRTQYGGYSLPNRCKSNNFRITKMKQYKGVIYINDSLKLATSYRPVKPVVMLYENIQLGDSIELENNNDTLYLHRNGQKEWFIYYGDSCINDKDTNKIDTVSASASL